MASIRRLINLGENVRKEERKKITSQCWLFEVMSSIQRNGNYHTCFVLWDTRSSEWHLSYISEFMRVEFFLNKYPRQSRVLFTGGLILSSNHNTTITTTPPPPPPPPPPSPPPQPPSLKPSPILEQNSEPSERQNVYSTQQWRRIVSNCIFSQAHHSRPLMNLPQLLTFDRQSNYLPFKASSLTR